MNSEDLTTRMSDNVKMAGFLEKKGKMKLVSPWKKYWFVLEERLLLYYKSQIEYINLSPCRGSLNMGLVSTVRPGASSGPCVIHVITRTQVVQLRAKDRAIQEEWLQALLDSMSLPAISKNLTVPLTTGLHCLRYSMDNIPASDEMKQEFENRQRTLPHRLSHRKNEMFGGSLDTAVWSKKFKTTRSPSPNIPKGKMLEKILGYVEEIDVASTSDGASLCAEGSNVSLTSITKKDHDKSPQENPVINLNATTTSEETKTNEVPDENQNHDFYSIVDKSKKKEKHCVHSNNELTISNLEEPDTLKTADKENSRFERIKNAITRKPKEKIEKPKQEAPTKTKKRRQSFLQKVFKRHYKKRETEKGEGEGEDESDTEDPLYDTIDNVQEQKDNIVVKKNPEENNKNETMPEGSDDIKVDSVQKKEAQPLYTEIQKPVFGSKNILSAQAMSELKQKLKSRESLERQEIEITKFSKQDETDSELVEVYLKVKGNDQDQDHEKNPAPALPPRRGSRPRSPWHDVPTNNAPINEYIPTFNAHQAMVRFYDDLPVLIHECSTEIGNDDDTSHNVSSNQGKKEADLGGEKKEDLSKLLEQLTEITTAPLTGSVSETEKLNSFSSSDVFWSKPRLERRFSDPDYDIPRPHKVLNINLNNEIDRIKATEFLGKSDDTSDGSSHPSMEPDSLEASENSKK